LKKIFEKLVLREFLDDDNQLQFNWAKEAMGPDFIQESKEQ
jgi:hypothetical protein